jgi:hypothetical protein
MIFYRAMAALHQYLVLLSSPELQRNSQHKLRVL